MSSENPQTIDVDGREWTEITAVDVTDGGHLVLTDTSGWVGMRAAGSWSSVTRVDEPS